MSTDLSIFISVLSLITDIIALVLNLVDFYKGRDGPMESEKPDNPRCRIYVPSDTWILIIISGPDGTKKPHPVARQDEEGR